MTFPNWDEVEEVGDDFPSYKKDLSDNTTLSVYYESGWMFSHYLTPTDGAETIFADGTFDTVEEAIEAANKYQSL